MERVEISPRKQVAELDAPIQLRAIAHFSDGTTEDVTRRTVFSPEDASAVEVEKDTAVSKVLRRGRHIVIARYLDGVVPIEFIVPLTDSKVGANLVFAPTAQPRRNFIDDAILKLLSTLPLPVSPPVDDATFLRRVTLDLTGRLPAAGTVTAFLADPNPKKRETLVDNLLQSKAFNEYWTLQLAKLLRIRSQGKDTQDALAYHQWLSQQISAQVGYDQLVRSVILATGDSQFRQSHGQSFVEKDDGARAGGTRRRFSIDHSSHAPRFADQTG
ncbi:DUF1549 domain-containing protein [Candidatus Poribacteria bacterium]|nr:DUF1549 domain-containing protein [Candidatus Poribacteria bacterium]